MLKKSLDNLKEIYKDFSFYDNVSLFPFLQLLLFIIQIITTIGKLMCDLWI